MNRSLPVAAAALFILAACAATTEGDDVGSSEDAISACSHSPPDRSASTLSAIPFQKLDRQSVPPATASIAWKYPTRAGSMPNNFGAGRSYNEGHEGADLGGGRGDPIFAAANGTIVYTLTGCPDNDTRRDKVCGNGWGNHVVIDHGSSVYTRYAHLQSFTVKVGDRVTGGAQIGKLGHTGLSDGPHLHFELGTKAAQFDPCKAPQNFDKVYNPAKLRYNAAPVATFPKGCKVKTDSANVRSSPNGTIIKTLNTGASVQAVSAQGSWYAVKFRLGGIDWGEAANPAFIHDSQLSCVP
jgi:murein DD-endopeptidase MepM/ murein hydrolase activator NlpD